MHPPKVSLSQVQSDAWHYLNDGITTEVLYGGAAGGGKSFLGCLWHIYRRTTLPETRGVIGRAKITNLEQSTLITMFRVCAALGYRPGEHYTYNAQKHIINWRNGSQTILKDLFYYPSDPEFISLGSTEYTDAFIDEGTEITLKAFDILNSRIRFMVSELGLVPKILVTCNPSAGWIKDKYLYDPLTDKPVELRPDQKFIRAMLTDNPDPDFVNLYGTQLRKMHSQYDIDRLLYGDWNAKAGTNNPFLYALDESVHFDSTIAIRPDKPVIFITDFNLEPFAGLVVQIFTENSGLFVHFLEQIPTGAVGSVPAMADSIRLNYGQYLYSCKLSGDKNGKNRNLSERDNASNYELLRRLLGLRQNQLVLPPNPTHVQSRNDVNYLFHIARDPRSGIHVKVNPKKCPVLANELRITQCDENHSIIKLNRSKEEERADYLDCSRYTVNSFLRPHIERHKKMNATKNIPHHELHPMFKSSVPASLPR